VPNENAIRRPKLRSPACAGDLLLSNGQCASGGERLISTARYGAPEHAVGLDADGLLVAGRSQRDVSVEAGCRGHDLEIAAAAAALQGATDIAAVSAQVPETTPPWSTTLAVRLNL